MSKLKTHTGVVITREQALKIIDAADEAITALAGTNEEVHPEDDMKMCRLWDDLNDKYAPPEVVRELAHIALASLEAELVAWTDEQELRDVEKDGFGYLFTVNPITPHADPRRVIKLFTAPPALVVPEPLELLRSIVADPRALPRRKEWISGQQYSYVLLENVEAMVEEACRAAMLSTQWRSHGKK